MKTTFVLLAMLTGTGFAADIVTQGALTDINFELSRLRQQLQVIQQTQAKPVATYVPGETQQARAARHAQVLAEAEAAYKADWQAKNPLLPSFRAPKFHKQLADQALAASDAQQAANAQYQAPPRSAPDPQLAAIQRRIKTLEAQLAATKKKAKK